MTLRIVFYGLLVAAISLGALRFCQWHREQSAAIDTTQAQLTRQPVSFRLGTTALVALPADYHRPSNVWVMTNKTTPIQPTDFKPNDLVPVPLPVQPHLTGEQASVRKAVATALKRLDHAATQQGVHLMINSAYRSYATQQQLIEVGDHELYDSGSRTAPAGASEHQLGLAVDFSTDTPACRAHGDCAITDRDAAWLAAHAHTYGFTLRYPEGREQTTGYHYEPWHFRYVGTAVAGALHQHDMVLEDAWPTLEKARAELIKRGEVRAG